MNTQQMIHRYAYLMTGVEREAAQGRQPPPQVIHEMNRIYARASAMLTPGEAQQALAAVNTLKAQYHHQAEVQAASRQAHDSQFYMDKLAREAVGMTADQVRAAARGEKIPVKGKQAVNVDVAKQTIAKLMKSVGKPDVDMAKFQAIADQYTETRTMRGAQVARDYLAEEFGRKHLPKVEAIVQGWEDSGLPLAIGLQAARGGPEPDHYQDVDEDTQRRAQLVENWAELATKDKGLRDSFIESDRISDESLESEHSWGDVARAFHQHEQAAESVEREGYSTPQYNIEAEDHAVSN